MTGVQTCALPIYSVVRLIRVGETPEGAPELAVQFLRRARGFAPVPLSTAATVTVASENEAAQGSATGSGAASEASADSAERPGAGIVFATGPEQKNTFTLLRGTDGFVSQHIGDVENADTYDAWLATKDRFESLFEMKPAAVACDLHPEYQIGRAHV